LFTEEELKIIEILEDPVKWAEATLSLRDGPFQARWYQKEVSDHIIGKDKDNNPSGIQNRVVLRWGRRMGKTTIMAVILLWYTFTHNNGKIVIAAPYESQVALIFKMVREFIKESPTLTDSVNRDTKSPHYIEMKNGSTIAGFTSGVRSGAKGDSMRGQAADWIIMDEMDRMGDEDIDSISAIALEDADRIGIIASSTPTGRRGKFYGFCMTPEIWWQSHRPSWNNPTWSDRTEKEFRSMLSEQGYIHEVEAEFGEETTGVFKKEHIERAKYDYQYPDKAAYSAHRIMGVDWDKYQATPQIVITEFDPEFTDHAGKIAPKFKVVYRSDIQPSEFTLDNAVQEIIRLNKEFQPRFIYCDRGFGEYQIELLRKHGLKHPETCLDKIVKGISFSQKIPIRDPATKEMDNKDIKPFMVNQTSVLMERDQIALNKNDELLWKQMQNYQVVKTTIYGRPIYTSEDEHTLDAFMLTILGFTIEFPNITQILQEFVVARSMGALPKINKLFHHENPDKGDDFWDPTDPDETSYRYLKKDQIKVSSGIPNSPQANTTRVTSWSPRATSFGKTPKKRGW
jgi:replicative DNA helicase